MGSHGQDMHLGAVDPAGQFAQDRVAASVASRVAGQQYLGDPVLLREDHERGSRGSMKHGKLPSEL